MDKNIIKKHLTNTFIKEEATPGIEMAKTIKSKEEKINKAGVKEIDKDMTSYDKSLKQEDKGKNNMAVNKFNYTDDAEKTYHDEMEILNGLEMTRYTSETGEGFKDRAKKAIEGDSTMGNAKGGNAEAAWGASDDDFGKKLVKRVKDSEKKRDDAFIATYELGDKIIALPDEHKVQRSSVAVGNGSNKGDTTKTPPSASSKPKKISENFGDTTSIFPLQRDKMYTWTMGAEYLPIKYIGKREKFPDVNVGVTIGHGYLLQFNDGKYIEVGPQTLRKYLEAEETSDTINESRVNYDNMSSEELQNLGRKAAANMNHAAADFFAEKAQNKRREENKNIKDKKIQTNESMKRLKFKKEFNGVGNALKLIPESYKVNNKEFEMTDTNETYRIRWEGTLNEGRAVVLTASNKTMVNEDINRMKALFNYKSEDTLGLVKGTSRINEDSAFTDVWNKTKKLLSESEEDEETTEEVVEESENIEGQKASKTAPFEEAGTPVAPEVPSVHKKSLQSKDGTAPAAPTKDADKAVSVAPEVPSVHKKKLQTKDGTAPAPKNGPWEEASVNEGENIEGQKASKTAPFEEAGTPVAPEVPSVHKKKLQEKDGTAPAAPTKDADDAVSVAPEVPAVHKTKLQTKDGTAPAPKNGKWEEASVPHAADAKKHIHMHEEVEIEDDEDEDDKIAQEVDDLKKKD